MPEDCADGLAELRGVLLREHEWRQREGLSQYYRPQVRRLRAAVFVSQTVKDLVSGSGLSFAERGEHELKGIPGTWRLYAVLDRPPSN